MYRERLTITLDAELLQAVDALVDGESLRNRSQTIEHLLKEGIGLHRLDQAFLFLYPDYEPSRPEALVRLMAAAGIKTIYLVSFIGQPTELAISIGQLVPEATVSAVPSDFGSGGALLLKHAELDAPFLIARADASRTPLPTGLLTPYVFHRQHQAPLTSLLCPRQDGYASAGLWIADPSLLASIPAGIVSLEDSVFPVLLKEAKVRAYPFTT
ncbi:MAG: hypothetical protein WCO52_00860 [bacterium]